MVPKLMKISEPQTSSSVAATSPQKRRLSELTVQPKKQARAQSNKSDKKPRNAPIQMCVWKYSDEAQEYIRGAPVGAPLWCIRIDHEAWPNVTSALLDGLNAYLSMTSHPEGSPTNIRELQDFGIRVNITRLNAGGRNIPNPDNAPIEEYSVVMWCVGNKDALENYFILMDGYFQHRRDNPLPADRSPWPSKEEMRVEIHPCHGVDLAGLDQQVTAITTQVNAAKKILPKSVFSFWPAWGNRFYKSEIEVVDEDSAIVAFDGRTYDIRARFEDMDYDRPAGNLRVLKQEYRDMRQQENVQLVLQSYGDAVLKGSVCALQIINEEAATDGSATKTMIDEVRALPSVHDARF